MRDFVQLFIHVQVINLSLIHIYGEEYKLSYEAKDVNEICNREKGVLAPWNTYLAQSLPFQSRAAFHFPGIRCADKTTFTQK